MQEQQQHMPLATWSVHVWSQIQSKFWSFEIESWTWKFDFWIRNIKKCINIIKIKIIEWKVFLGRISFWFNSWIVLNKIFIFILQVLFFCCRFDFFWFKFYFFKFHLFFTLRLLALMWRREHGINWDGQDNLHQRHIFYQRAVLHPTLHKWQNKSHELCQIVPFNNIHVLQFYTPLWPQRSIHAMESAPPNHVNMVSSNTHLKYKIKGTLAVPVANSR